MIELVIGQALLPLIVTGVVSLFVFFINSKTQATLLQQNIKSTEALSGAVNELRIQLGIFGERYVTRDELERKLREIYNGT